MAQMQIGPAKCVTARAQCRPINCLFRAPSCRAAVANKSRLLVRSADSKVEGPAKGGVIENPDSETAKKQAEIERLRAAEKFMVIGSGEATCQGCGYEYSPKNGDPEFPVAKGVSFQDVPVDYICPICGAPKDRFEARVKVVAGFAENQQYGFGTNTMTGEQKQLLIWGAFAAFFLFFIAGYGLN